MPRGSNYHKPDGAEPAVTPPRARVKPRLRGVSHQWAFYLAIPLGVVLTLVAETSRARVAAAVFAASVVGMFGASALYHRVTWRPPTRRWIRRLDHAGIYVLIAVFAVALQPFLGLVVTAALANLEAARRFVAGWQARESSGVVGE